LSAAEFIQTQAQTYLHVQVESTCKLEACCRHFTSNYIELQLLILQLLILQLLIFQLLILQQQTSAHPFARLLSAFFSSSFSLSFAAFSSALRRSLSAAAPVAKALRRICCSRCRVSSLHEGHKATIATRQSQHVSCDTSIATHQSQHIVATQQSQHTLIVVMAAAAPEGATEGILVFCYSTQRAADATKAAMSTTIAKLPRRQDIRY
jgi:hypothetical protein